MRLKFTFLTIIISFNLIGQNPSKSDILTSYSIGNEIKELIEKSEIAELKAEFRQTDNINSLIELIQTEKFKSGVYSLNSDIYFNPGLNKFIFTIYSYKWIKTDSDWGLNDYLFVIELEIEHKSDTGSAKISNRHILNQNSDLKNWWRSLMLSYRNPKFLRDKWAADFKLVPPPPPPPQTIEWF